VLQFGIVHAETESTLLSIEWLRNVMEVKYGYFQIVSSSNFQIKLVTVSEETLNGNADFRGRGFSI